ncbi:MAG: hypothetical protein CMN31_01725 [Sandaracinus sp.]|nr:hypothetical protein [Myxococcales bacterium]MAT26318.1 hypothetical protein [Sandaracinus sp.]MBJ70081.1 hypothetical protein [Sandaracinus sp.]
MGESSPQAEEGFFVTLVRQESLFFALISLGFFAVGFVYEDPTLAAWVGFALAGYSAVANDSIQTIGTFIASNRGKPWWTLWIYIGGIFLLTVGWSWWAYDGDVTHQRLAAKGFSEAPTSFSYLQVAAPLVLMVLTRMRMPVSTSLLLLSCFATEPSGIGKVLTKSVAGYGVAFVVAILVWLAVSKALARFEKAGEPHPGWRVFQWVSSGALWSVWVMQDAANIAIYLPRQLSVLELAGFAGVVFVGLGLLFKFGGARVQKVVDEKSSVEDVRSATVIDFVYAIILYVFKVHSKVPMSTTWVFIGLLAGREIAMSLRHVAGHGRKHALKLMGKDLLYVTIGLVVSVGLAMAVNERFADAVFD